MLSTVQKTPVSKCYGPAVIAVAPPQVIVVPQLLDPLASLATILSFDRDDEIVFQGEPAEYCYEIVSGCVRTVRSVNSCSPAICWAAMPRRNMNSAPRPWRPRRCAAIA
jgi:hypothetical protein